MIIHRALDTFAIAQKGTTKATNAYCRVTPRRAQVMTVTANNADVTCKKCLKALAKLAHARRELSKKIRASIEGHDIKD